MNTFNGDQTYDSKPAFLLKESTISDIDRILTWDEKIPKKSLDGSKNEYYKKCENEYYEKIFEFKKVLDSKDKFIVENTLAYILREEILLFFLLLNEFDLSDILKSGALREEGKNVAAKLFCEDKDFYKGERLCKCFNYSDAEKSTIYKKIDTHVNVLKSSHFFSK